MPLELPLAPKAKSLRSNSKTVKPRSVASRSTPTPFTPPPITITSRSSSRPRGSRSSNGDAGLGIRSHSVPRPSPEDRQKFGPAHVRALADPALRSIVLLLASLTLGTAISRVADAAEPALIGPDDGPEGRPHI